MSKKTAKRAKITTIEGLAAAMAEGFSDLRTEMNDRFSDLHAGMNARFDRVEEKLGELDHRLTAVESKILGIQRRLDEEAMERVDVRALLARMERIEVEVFGKKQI